MPTQAHLNFFEENNRIIGQKNLINPEISSSRAVSDIFGKVVSHHGEPLVGVSIIVKGTTRGTTTDADGNFKIWAEKGETLVISFIGYHTEEIRIHGENTLNITLEESSTLLSDIIVTGTRSQGRTKIDTPVPVDIIPLSEVTNNVGQVDINQILTFVAPSFQSSR